MEAQEQATAEVRAITRDVMMGVSERQRPTYLGTETRSGAGKKMDVSPVFHKSPQTPGSLAIG